MPSNNRQKTLETLPPSFDDLVREPIGEDLARQRRNVHAGGFTLEDVTEGFEVGVTPTDDRMAQLECRNVGLVDEKDLRT